MENLKAHFVRHRAAVARLRGLGPASAQSLWQTRTKEFGEPLSPFEQWRSGADASLRVRAFPPRMLLQPYLPKPSSGTCYAQRAKALVLCSKR